MSNMKTVFTLSLLAILCLSVSGMTFPRNVFQNFTMGLTDDYTPISYKTGWYETELDHFNFEVKGTFKMRYLYNDEYFRNTPENPGPIFVYVGNEGPIDAFWGGSGFWTNVMTQKHGALILFLEHRYFGESLPFDGKVHEGKNIQYLNTEQALADYGLFLPKFKKERGIENSPVITFGGSYGGMLAAWIRMKYPQAVDGAIASSAPLLMFQNITNSNAHSAVITEDYTNVGCGGLFKEGFQLLYELQEKTEAYDTLTKELNLCEPITDSTGILGVYDFIRFSLGAMAQYDYPYPTTFNGPMPASPVAVSCEKVMKALNFDTAPTETAAFLPQDSGINMKLLKGMMEAANVAANPFGTNKCNNAIVQPPSLHDGPSDFLACIGSFPVGTNGVTDFFWDQPWDYEAYAAECEKKWGISMRPLWMPEHYGGVNYQRDFAMFSNIIFSNGALDPWHVGGVLESIEGAKDMIALFMQGAAHHLDLRYPSLADPIEVTRGRQTEDFYVMKWVREAIERNLKEPNKHE